MTPAWLEPWLGSPLDALDEARLTMALEAARQVVDRLSLELHKERSSKGQAEVEGLLAEWQSVIGVLLRARADRYPALKVEP